MKTRMKLLLFSVLVILTSCNKNLDKRDSYYIINSEEIAKSVTIYRDIYGIPHIKGPSDESVIFGFAFARAEDRFGKIENQYIKSIGRLAEVEGEEGKSNDIRVKAFEIEKLAKEEYENLSPKVKLLCDAYAQGLNYYLQKNPEIKPKLLTEFEPWYILAEYKNFGFPALGQVRLNDQMIVEYLEDDIKSIGSNAFALGGGKTKSNNTILVINPHLNLYEPYEVQLTSEEGLNFYGMVSYGSGILPVMGHNENLGWAWTTNNPDVVDAYEIQFNHPSDSNLYKVGDEYLAALHYEDTIKIREENGYRYEIIHFRKSIHGPILSESKSGKPISIKLAGLEKGGMLEQIYAMTRALNLDSFKKALSKNALIIHNITYADKEGNILYVYNGTIPKRDTTFNWRQPVDGSDTLTQWQGYHSLMELPQVLNPECQYVQNCNNKPFNTTTLENPDPSDFPEYMTYYQRNSQRSIRARTILDTIQDATIESLESAIFDTYVQSADAYIVELLKEVEEVRKLDSERINKIVDPLSFLESWNRYSNSASEETSLFYIWTFKRFYQKRIKATYPNLVAFERAVEKLENEKGTWKVPWRDIYRHQRSQEPEQYSFDSQKTSYPISGGISLTGIMFASSGGFKPYLPDIGLKELNIRAQFGDSYVSVVEFGDQVKAKSIIPYGESDNPTSLHYTDQASLYAQGKLKPVLFTENEILDNLKAKYSPGEIKWK